MNDLGLLVQVRGGYVMWDWHTKYQGVMEWVGVIG